MKGNLPKIKFELLAFDTYLAEATIK